MREPAEVGLRVWLADLTYTQQGVSAETMPQAIGGLATYAATRLRLAEPMRVFKYPRRLAGALADDDPPDVLGFSNYVWNSNLSLGFARRVKQRFPGTVVVFGGPHYPVVAGEQERFLRGRLGAGRPFGVDFYVCGEGEHAFTELLAALAHGGREAVEAVHGQVAGVHSIAADGRAHLPAPGPRLADLTAVPSPYLAGLMDEFFDGALVPTVQTNRGCPFTCAFCVEGTRYYSKVATKHGERVAAELRYIAERMVPLLADGRGRNELLITDSNFGMFPQDRATCAVIARCQAEFGWPRYVNVTTGKNKRDRVLEAVSLVNGAINLSGAVQSLDPQVLANVKRANIDAGALMDVALAAAARDTGAYSEVILALPGDSKAKHFASLRQLIDAGFGRVNMFQLFLLPGADLYADEARARHEMTTRFRVMPRCAGRYEVLGERVTAVETDEVCVSLPSLPYSDYLHCRLMNLLVGVFYNDGAFAALTQGLRACGVSVFDWLAGMHARLLTTLDAPASDTGDALASLARSFVADTDEQLWADQDELERHAVANIDRYLAGEVGLNLLYTYRARLLAEALDETCALAGEVWLDTLAAAGIGYFDEPLAGEFVAEASEYHRLRLAEVFTARARHPRAQPARFDLDALLAAPRPARLDSYLLDRPTTRHFVLTGEQVRVIEGYLNKFGDSAGGAGRMLSKIRMSDVLRRTHLSEPAGTSA